MKLKYQDTMKNLRNKMFLYIMMLYINVFYGQKIDDTDKSEVKSLIEGTFIGKIIKWGGNLLGVYAIIYSIKNAFELIKKINERKQQGASDDDDEGAVIKNLILKTVITLIVGFGIIGLINYVIPKI